MISDRELQVLKEHQEIYMPETVTIRQPQFFGDNEREYVTLETGVPARITPGFGWWRSVADRFQGITAHTITVPWDTEIQAGWVIIDSHDRAYEVRDVRAPSSFQTAKQLLTDRVTDD